MTDKIFIFFLFAIAVVFLATIIALPTVIAFFINRWLTKKGIKYAGLFLLVIAPVWTAYEVYTAIYPTDSFYKDEFEYNTGLNFPNSGEILTKDASYPDLHGDYSATALFKTDQNDFNLILKSIQEDTKFQIDTIPFKFNLANFDTKIKETNFTKCYTLNRQDRDLIFTISFNDNDNLIEIQRDSW